MTKHDHGVALIEDPPAATELGYVDPPAQPQRVPEGFDWREVDGAPINRNIYLSVDPDEPGTLCYWRRTRYKVPGQKGWQVKAYWASVLTHRKLDFDPYCWREAVGAAALASILEAETE